MVKSCIDAILAADKDYELCIKLKDLAKLKPGKVALKLYHEFGNIYFESTRKDKLLKYEAMISQKSEDVYTISFRLKR